MTLSRLVGILGLLTLVGIFSFNASNHSLAQTNNLVLVAESNSYVPVNYQGARPLSYGSDVSLIALGIARSATYNWYINNRLVPEYSGIGQNRITLNVGDHDINARVVVKDDDQTIAQDSIEIKPEPVELVFYQDHPTRGVLWHSSIGNTIRTTSPSINVLAAAYGAEGSFPEITWKINNASQVSDFVTLTRNSGLTRNLEASYTDNSYNRVAESLQILFSNRTS